MVSLLCSPKIRYLAHHGSSQTCPRLMSAHVTCNTLLRGFLLFLRLQLETLFSYVECNNDSGSVFRRQFNARTKKPMAVIFCGNYSRPCNLFYIIYNFIYNNNNYILIEFGLITGFTVEEEAYDLVVSGPFDIEVAEKSRISFAVCDGGEVERRRRLHRVGGGDAKEDGPEGEIEYNPFLHIL